MIKTLILLFIAATVAAAGHVFLSKGMKEIGMISTINAKDLILIYKNVFTNQAVILGIFLQLIFFLIYLATLSRADLSFVLPITAIDYILITMFAKYFLLENVSAMRWTGTLLIVIGVILVSKS